MVTPDLNMALENETLNKLAEAISDLSASTSIAASSGLSNSQTTGNQDSDLTAIHAVSLKLPEFWTDDPAVWFVRVEAQFRSRAITLDSTKFDYVVTALDNRTAAEVKAIICQPPPQNQYVALKTALISAFGKSQTQKDNELFSICGLGDRKPSSLLRKIESLNNDADTLRRAFFLAQLPSQVRAILASQKFADIHELALTADRIVEANNLPQPTVNTINRRKTPTNHVKRSGPVTDQPFICYFHRRFGPDARTCRPGCRFAKLLETTTNTNPNSQGNEIAGRH